MNFGAVLRAFDTVVALREVARRVTGGAPPEPPPDAGVSQTTAVSGIAGQIEARLTNVVVAALKEAFDRDHARLELERAQVEEARRRAEEAMRQELRRQAADRELGRLRMLAATALIGWVASVLLLVVRLGDASIASRAVLGAGWLLLLASLAAAFSAQGRIGRDMSANASSIDAGAGGVAALWLLVVGLAVAAASLMF
jgi:hypothetical protein